MPLDLSGNSHNSMQPLGSSRQVRPTSSGTPTPSTTSSSRPRRATSSDTPSRGRFRSRAERYQRRLSGWQGVPARFMRPRVGLLITTTFLVLFGLVMVYSASSVESLSENGSASYYVIRQGALTVFGAAGMYAMIRIGYHSLCEHWLKVLWLGIFMLLCLTKVLGLAGGGAVRWLKIAGFTVQPSEFAKLTLVMSFAVLCQRYFEDHSIDTRRFTLAIGLTIVLPLLLIAVQPDKGTTIIIVFTLFVMLMLSGFPLKPLLGGAAVAIALAFVVIMGDSYSRERVLTALDPWSDPYNTGYQLIQGFIAFGNGGLFGVGIGQSSQKYSFLPEAHNDFIFAVVGEECGLVGTLLVVAAFIALVYFGFKIARYAPDLSGKLIAAGSTTILGFQFLVNVCGILGITPMTGKPLPFLSYGGTAMLSCLWLVGLILAVSEESVLPETIYDKARGRISLTSGGGTRQQGYSETYTGTEVSQKSGFTLLSGGASNKRERIDLGPSATDRLRSKDSPRTSRTYPRKPTKRR